MTEQKECQLASAVLMIRPTRFESNSHTAASNVFQGKNPDPPEQQQEDAAREFAGLCDALKAGGVEVIQFEDTEEPHTPDSVFPNNWVSFHADGAVVYYPMMAPNRRAERRPDVINALADDYGFQIREIIDLSEYEDNDEFLEGTGSLVLDRTNRIAYACLSARTHLKPLGDFAQRMDYEVVAFHALDRGGTPIYHTNVLMNVGEECAFICATAIPRNEQRRAVLTSLEKTGREVFTLSFNQMEAFAGNMLELRAQNGKRVVVMSNQALKSLNHSHISAIEANAEIISVSIDSIECSAGGSVRCMLAEIHLQR